MIAVIAFTFAGGMFVGACVMALWIGLGEIDDQGDPLPRGRDREGRP